MGRFENTPGQYFRYNCLKCLALTQENSGGMGIALESIVLFFSLRQKIAISSGNFTLVREKRYQISDILFRM